MKNLFEDHSDQEELVENVFSAVEDDDDNDDDDDEDYDDENDVFSDGIHLEAETEELISISLVKSSNDCDALLQVDRSPNVIIREQQQQQQNIDAARKTKRSICFLIAYSIGLMITSFLLLILLPLYQSQFNIESINNNAHGMIIFIQSLATLFLILTTIICSAVFKWDIRLLKLPSIPIKKLILISACFGLASSLVIVGSYKRVTCHLQDPLKGTALAFSLLFYFFFCTRSMGLQKIFSATTSVVGLFISVDYGLCDEFHCRGNVVSFKEKLSHSGWQGRAFWALIYTVGILLWSLHVAILEGCFADANEPKSKQTNFLKTISKFVSSHDDQNTINDTRKVMIEDEGETCKNNIHPLHVAMWIHIIGTMFALLFGFVDVFQVSDTQIKTFTQHWSETKHTIQCHLNISSNNHIILDFNSNISKETTIINAISKSINTYNHTDSYVHNDMSIHHNRTRRSSAIDAKKHHQHKISHLNAFLKYKNATSHHHLPSMSGNTKNVGHKKIKVDCSHNIGFYALILILTYVGFVACLFNVLNISQSAVFTVAMATGTLPFTGLFWSFYKLDTQYSLNAAIVWSPSVSGELICSLLGTPIVFLGIVFLFKSHYSDTLKKSRRSGQKIMIT